MVYKMNESIIVIQAEATSPNRTNVVFWSHDRGTAKLRMKLVRKNGIPQSLPEGTTVPIRLMFKSATAEGGYGKHDYLATIEDPVNGIVSIVLEDNILGYVGTVEGSVYIDFPNDRSLDTAGRFTFYIKRSPIDDSTPELEDYYFNGFSQTIDKIEKILADGKQEIEQKITESETQIDGKLKDTNDKITKANQDVATLNTNIDKANDRIDQTNQQIGDLGKLKKMYSNSIDFGDYDYSGNPNLMTILKASDFYPQSSATIEDFNGGLKVTFTKTDGATFLESRKNIPALLPNKQYTLSADITVTEGYSGNLENLRLGYRKNPNGTIILPLTAKDAQVGKKTRIFITANSSSATDPSIFNKMYFTINTTSTDPFVGTVLIENIKVEQGTNATPYQPNLLEAPYYLSKAPLGENIADPKIKFPVKSSGAEIYTGTMIEPFVAGETYTITIKGTKPETQIFRVSNPGIAGYGNLSPVEGLTDVWSLTFTPDKVSSNPKILQIVQSPNESVGACQIDWLKIEKGDTRTPNISQFKYFGEGLKDSNNPNDYSWDIKPEYTEKGLNNTVSLTEPQSVDGTKNFLETPLVNGKNVLVEEKPLPYEAWHSTGTEQTGISNKARLIIGPVATTIGAKLNRSMKENPLTWNSGNWQATANRDCTLLVEGLVRYQFGGSTAGQYGYITFYKDDAQTSSIGFAGGVGINGTALQWKHGLHFSRIFALKKGEYFNITFETQDGKNLDFSQINTLHIMEIES
ncbi:BppU family phage baseplate upper protein [Enterococcus faecium]|uniref:BppU family phage baseplate upper protein n=1 Tax=Enterococcus faecium TaxID=1352 RepID=UPI002891F1A3|nr:BppU family phage baseplate upper protein [Enterococcus faecium]MDT2283678.1 BppU family phage baseplate upper protein [Enterococcus faecium]